MNPLEFVAAVAWPVAILSVALIYRAPLARLVAGERTTLKAGPFELAWENARPSLPRPVPVSVDPRSRLSRPTGRLASLLVDLAREAPVEAIVTAYRQLGEAFGHGLAEVGIELDAAPNDALALAGEAERAGVTGPEITNAVQGLQVLCGLAEHGPQGPVSEGRAFEYLAMADSVLYSIAAALSKYGAREDAQQDRHTSGTA